MVWLNFVFLFVCGWFCLDRFGLVWSFCFQFESSIVWLSVVCFDYSSTVWFGLVFFGMLSLVLLSLLILIVHFFSGYV